MKAREKTKFVRELVANVQRDILAKVPDMPEEWDGHELRQFVADRFAASASMSSYFIKDTPRRRAYRNTVLVNNL